MPKVLLTEAARRAERDRRADEEIVALIGAYKSITGRNTEQLATLCGMKYRTLHERIKKPSKLRMDEYRMLMDEILKVVGADGIC